MVERRPDDDFHDVFRENYGAVLGFFRKRRLLEVECEDLAQQVFLRAYEGWEAFEARSAVSTWLFKICVRVWSNELRRRSTLKRKAEELSLPSDEDFEQSLGRFGAEDGASPQGQLLEREALAAVQAQIEQLPEKMRECLLLRVARDLSNREIASLLGLSPETVKAHLFQARRRLKASLQSTDTRD